MTASRVFGCAAVALVLLAAAGCRSSGPIADSVAGLRAQEAREALLAEPAEWRLSGRVAVSGGGDGGNGRLQWRHQPDHDRVEIQAPVTRQSWRLDVRPGQARLDGLDGGPRLGSDAVELLEREVGWLLPLRQLGHWVRGVRAPGVAEIEFAADGLPYRLDQDGWTIEYRDWQRELQPPLPRKVFAQRGERRIRLLIDDWQVDGTGQ